MDGPVSEILIPKENASEDLRHAISPKSGSRRVESHT
jgi:hypothetical protein